MKSLIAALVLAATACVATAEQTQSTADAAPLKPTFIERMTQLNGAAALSQTCCKRCNKGKACGDSCISKSKSCSKGQGCACN